MHYPLVTLVGGSGFVGRHTVKLFTENGWRVQVLCRDTVAAEFLRTAGYPGQVVLDHVDITRPGTLENKFVGSDVVVNLVSILLESGRQKFPAINVAGAGAIAQQAAKAGSKRFVQVSALGVDHSSAVYAKTKCMGEAVVREIFSDAVVLRPSLIVGPEDGFFQRFARLSTISPVLPLIGGGHTKFQPVLVGDVAQAIFQAATHTDCAGKTYMLGGPNIYSFRQLLEMLARITKRRTRLISLPFALAYLKGMVAEILPLPPIITRDQVRLLRTDNVVPAGSQTLRELGITPGSVEAALPELLARYVKG